MTQQPFGQPQQQYSAPANQGGGDVDLFASDGAPSLSFKDAPIGTVHRMEVTKDPVMLQSRDFNTGEPDFWPAGRDGVQNPKMAIVVNGIVDGEERSIWATKPSSMFAAIASAQKEAGMRVGPGVLLEIAYTHDKPNENPKLNAAKQYQARVSRGAPGGVGDAFATAPAQQVQQPVQQPQQAFPPAQAQQPATVLDAMNPAQQQAFAQQQPAAAPQGFPPPTQAQAPTASPSPWDTAPTPPGGAPF